MINLAVEELITNAVSYGLEGVVQPRIEIAENAGTALWSPPSRVGRVGPGNFTLWIPQLNS